MKRRALWAFFLTLLLVPAMVFANSMEPPGVVVIVEGRPEGLDVWLDYEGGGIVEGQQKVWPCEVQYWFYHHAGFDAAKEAVLHVEAEGIDRQYLLDELTDYRSTFTVRLDEAALIPGKTLLRSVLLVGIRVLLTLAIEGLVFLLMGFRSRRSWRIFLLVNLATQTALNIYINSMNVAAGYPVLFGLVFGEFWIFIAEGIALPLLLREKGRLRRLAFAVLANAASLVLGGYLMTWLPF